MIVIVGASGYLGKALYDRCGKGNYGNDVVTLGRSDSDIYVDVCDSESYEHIELDKIIELLAGRKIDALVFCQGINPHRGIIDVTDNNASVACHNSIKIVSDAIAMFEANIISSMMIVRRLQHLIKHNGAVVMLGSVASRKGSFDPAYAASKAAMTGLMHSLAQAYKHIRFNIVSPGLIRNSPVHCNMVENMGHDYVEEKHISKMQGESLIDVNDVVDTIMMIINNKSIASTEIYVDRGMKL